MKIFNVLMIEILFFTTLFAEDLEFKINSIKTEKMPFVIGIVDKETDDILFVANRLKDDLEFSGQFLVDIKNFSQLKKKSDLADQIDEKTALGVFLTDNGDSVGFRLYDLFSFSMLDGKNYKKNDSGASWWAHNIADKIWPLLTGQDGFFSSKIAFCRTIWGGKRGSEKIIYIADYDGKDPKELVKNGSVNLAPRWNCGSQSPILFYSECAPANMRLIATNMRGKKKVVSNFEGLNMLPSCSPDGKKVVVCLSFSGSSQLYSYHFDAKRNKNVYVRLTNNDGNNVSPILLANGDVIFCSDFESKSPRIYQYSASNKSLEQITSSGYCAAPSYSEKANKLAYSRMEKGIMQIFIYDFKTKVHKQLTFDNAQKEEASWSPCGNYLLFSVESESNTRLAYLNLLTNQIKMVGGPKSNISYPSWSPIYSEFPAI
ncbi:MAG: Protein TolB [candidate division TM6 bacterium GW2011_GWF2_32_72]|nr:MAG: Protein TolB [candidate division TM6 bacterium GW2011_GWF2_32_72]